jgi:protein TonB
MTLRLLALASTFALGIVSAGEPTASLAPPEHQIAPELRVVPLNRVAPNIPREALTRKISGWARIAGIITVEGRAKDLRVVAQDASGLYGQPSINAVKKWTFEPLVKDGVAVERPFEQLFEYRLE